MTLGHERFDVCRLSIGYVAWVYEKANELTGIHRPARDQWLRPSQSIPLSIAEGNGETADWAEEDTRFTRTKRSMGTRAEILDPDPDSDFDLDGED